MRGLHDIIWWGVAGLLASATPASARTPNGRGLGAAAVVAVTVVNANGQALGRGSVPRAGTLTLLAPADAPMQRAVPANCLLSDRRAVWTAAALGTANAVEVVLKPLGSVQGMRLIAVTDSGSEAIVLSDPQGAPASEGVAAVGGLSSPPPTAATAVTPGVAALSADSAAGRAARQRAEIARLMAERDAAVRLAKARADSAAAAEAQQAAAVRRKAVEDSTAREAERVAAAREAVAKAAAAKEAAAREAVRRKAVQDSVDREARLAAAQEAARRKAIADSVERQVQDAKARAAARIAQLAAEREAAERLAKARSDSVAAVAAEQAAARREAERVAAVRLAAQREAVARARADSIAAVRAAARRKAVEDSLDLEAARALEAKIQAERAAQREAERLAAAREAVRAASAREAAAREAREPTRRASAPATRVNGTLADEWNAVSEPTAPRSVADEWKAISGSAGRGNAPAAVPAAQPDAPAAASRDASATPAPLVRDTREAQSKKDARRETPRELPRAEPQGAPKKTQPGYSLEDLFRPTAQASPPGAGGSGGGRSAQEIADANARARQERARADSLQAARRREERARADSLVALRRQRAREAEAAAWYRGEYLPPEERPTPYGDALLDDGTVSTRLRGSLVVPGPLVSAGVERTFAASLSMFGDVALRPGSARKRFSRTAATPYAASVQVGARVLLDPRPRTAYVQADAGVAWDADGAGVFRGGLSLGVVTPLIRSTLLDVGVRGLSVHDRRFVSPSAYVGLATRLGGGAPAYVTPESEP